MSVKVGEVVAVRGTSVTLLIYEESSKDVIFWRGEKYSGVSIREHVSIQRGTREIVCRVEGEYLDEKNYDNSQNEITYIRKVEVKPIGHFADGVFHEGVKNLPMIKDGAFLMKDENIPLLYGSDSDEGICVGETLNESIPYLLPWKKVFNTHIGVFGNTGSGKSNTLSKLFGSLFDEKIDNIKGKSEFVLIDFNGEYTGDQLIQGDSKKTLSLDTSRDGSDKFVLHADEFWDIETLSLLFKATENTQKPFVARIVHGRNRYGGTHESLRRYIEATFKNAYTATSQKRETNELLLSVAKITGNLGLAEKLRSLRWHGQQQVFYTDASAYFNGDEETYQREIECFFAMDWMRNVSDLDEFVIRAFLQLVQDLIGGFVQFEHIQPLLKRAEASIKSLEKAIEVSTPPEAPTLTVVSLRRCNQEIKKIIPLLIAKQAYNKHKDISGSPPSRTLHLVVDEAHNILSHQSSREQESWKDYRIEMFEEIIKEGRKFGMFLTLASQRPGDISETIMSQIHNFFIHRLVNDRDLYLIDNTINTMDGVSKSMIPNLGKGSCVITGVSFDLPVLVQIHQVELQSQPDSDDVNLETLWVV